jgi:hypothetical protein
MRMAQVMKMKRKPGRKKAQRQASNSGTYFAMPCVM